MCSSDLHLAGCGWRRISVMLEPERSPTTIRDHHDAALRKLRQRGVSVNADGSFTYETPNTLQTLAAGETTTDSFNYTITDASNATRTATVSITISGVNDAPTADGDSFTISTRHEATIGGAGVLANDFDVDNGDTITISGVVYTAGTAENTATGTFQVFKSGGGGFTDQPHVAFGAGLLHVVVG